MQVSKARTCSTGAGRTDHGQSPCTSADRITLQETGIHNGVDSMPKAADQKKERNVPRSDGHTERVAESGQV